MTMSHKKKLNSVALVRERTIPTEQPISTITLTPCPSDDAYCLLMRVYVENIADCLQRPNALPESTPSSVCSPHCSTKLRAPLHFCFLLQAFSLNVAFETSYVRATAFKHLHLLLCGLVVRFPGYTTERYCASCEVRTEFIYVM
jgi:hypothetical protein